MANLAVIYKIGADTTALESGVTRATTVANGLATASNTTTDALGNVERSMNNVAKASGSVFDRMDAEKEQAKATALAHMDLYGWVNRSTGAFDDFTTSIKNAWNAFQAGGGFAGMMDRLGPATGLTVANLGAFNSLALGIGAAMAGWKIGTFIDQFTGLSTALGNATAKLLGWSTATQIAAAEADVMALARSRDAKDIRNAADALAYNTQWVKNHMEALRDLNDITERGTAYAKLGAQIADWRAELDKLAAEGVLGQLKDSIQTHLFTTKQLSDVYHISVGAIDLLKQRMEDEEAAHRASAEAAKRHAAEVEKAAEAYIRSAEKEAKAIQSVVTAQEDFARKVESQQAWPFPRMTGDVQKLTDMFPPLTQAGHEFAKSVNEWGDGIIQKLPELEKASKSFSDKFTGYLGDIGSILNNIGGDFADLANIGIRTTQSVMDHLANGDLWGAIIAGAAGAVAAIAKMWDKLKELFGGPSAEELAGREVVSKFEENLKKLLNGQELIEAGGESWKETVIAIRDAYLKNGLTEEQALADAKKLWESSKQGPQAVADIIKLITDRMNGLTDATHAASDAIGGMPTPPTGDGGSGDDGGATRATAALSAKAFGMGTNVVNVIVDGHVIQKVVQKRQDTNMSDRSYQRVA